MLRWPRPSTAKIAVFCPVIAALEVMFPLASVLQEALWCIALCRWNVGGSAEAFTTMCLAHWLLFFFNSSDGYCDSFAWACFNVISNHSK